MAAAGGAVTAREMRALSRGRMRSAHEHQCFQIARQRAYDRIRRAASSKRSSCAYEVPPIILGFPPYDSAATAAALAAELERNGFRVRREGDRALVIEW